MDGVRCQIAMVFFILLVAFKGEEQGKAEFTSAQARTKASTCSLNPPNHAMPEGESVRPLYRWGSWGHRKIN